jgi:hypothetical protein
VAELSRLLTSGRAERREGYLGTPALLSAYLRYFLPWNVYRLCRLLPALSLSLEPGDTLADLGSGPLTLPIALWISRPELRDLSLQLRCLDRKGSALAAGKRLFQALAGRAAPWKLSLIRAPLGTELRGKPAALTTAITLFDEVFRRIPPEESLDRPAERYGRLLSALTAKGGSVLAVEPGTPRSGEIVGALRASLIKAGRRPLAPCPHDGACPFPGKRGSKWCHFAFDTADAPEDLRKLSAAAGIPKDRAVLSFVFAGPLDQGHPARKTEAAGKGSFPVRIISDAFPLPCSRFGRYGCSERGLILVRGRGDASADPPPGSLIRPAPDREERDPKSGALVADLDGD